MKCPKCEAENPDDVEYCSLCFTRFQVQIKFSNLEEADQKIRKDNIGSKLRCPNCGDMSPLQSQFCLRCGYIFEDLEEILVSKEEIEGINREKEEAEKKELEGIHKTPITVTAESDGAEIIRGIEDILKGGHSARIHAHGRNATTYAMKIIALMGEDFRKKEKDMVFRAKLINDGAITDLDDLELEIILETK